jgi:hypothetical protein
MALSSVKLRNKRKKKPRDLRLFLIFLRTFFWFYLFKYKTNFSENIYQTKYNTLFIKLLMIIA